VHPRANAIGIGCVALYDRLIMHMSYNCKPFAV
jgi:hypothetical protein